MAERAALHKDRERGNFNYIKEQQNRNQLESMITKYHLNERENIVRQHIALEQKLNEASKSQVQILGDNIIILIFCFYIYLYL